MNAKTDPETFKAALKAGIRYAEGRGAVEFEATDSASDKALYVYRLLVKANVHKDAGALSEARKLLEPLQSSCHIAAEKVIADRAGTVTSTAASA